MSDDKLYVKLLFKKEQLQNAHLHLVLGSRRVELYLHSPSRLHGKVKLYLCLSKNYCTKIYGGVELPNFYLGSRWRWAVSLKPRPLYPREIASGSNWNECWVGPRAGLDAVEKIEILPMPGFEPRPSSQSLYRLSYPGSACSWRSDWLIN
jgi:hypothetical protein